MLPSYVIFESKNKRRKFSGSTLSSISRTIMNKISKSLTHVINIQFSYDSLNDDCLNDYCLNHMSWKVDRKFTDITDTFISYCFAGKKETRS